MFYKNIVYTNEHFQYSINLEYDLKNLKKIDSYIPTKLSMDILKKYLKSILGISEDKCTILVGPYGKGKSHLLLILTSIISIEDEYYDELSGLKFKEVIERLVYKIEEIDEECAILIRELRGKKELLLPVIINSNYLKLNQSFLLGLNNSLEREGLGNIVPRNYYSIAVNTIENWKRDYEDTYDKFEKILKEKYNHNIKKFEGLLKGLDEEAYRIFIDIYPNVTSGSVFNPLINGQIDKIYDNMAKDLEEKSKFKGIFIIFDEFSKFLEASRSKNTSEDIHLLQEISELASNKEDTKIYLTCVTHKDIEEYTSKLLKEQIDIWRGISGRFNHVYFASSSKQNYELIGNAIYKNKEGLNRILNEKENREIFETTLTDSLSTGLFGEGEEIKEIIGQGCFPLNPISIYVLPRVSEKVAQNERTMFTFICKNERYTLNDFIIKSNKFNLLTVDWIYDYFKSLLKKEVFDTYIYNLHVNTERALEKCNNKESKIVLKTLCMIYVVNELDKLSPTENILKLGCGLDEVEFQKTIKYLHKKNLIYKKSFNGQYSFGNLSDVNFEEKINNAINTKGNKVNILDVLKEITKTEYMLPREYNDNYEITRFFKIEYILSNQFNLIKDDKNIIKESKSDGIIYNLVYFDDKEKEDAIENLNNINSKRVLLCVSKQKFKKEDEIKKYWAIDYLIKNDNEINEDKALIEELVLLKEDLFNDISNYLKEEYNLSFGNCKYYIYKDAMSILDDVNKVRNLSTVLSKICNECYGNTPKITNELINKSKLSVPIKNARDKILEYILNGMVEEDELRGNAPEATIYRATIKNRGIKNINLSRNKKIELDYTNADENIKILFGEIRNFINKAREERKPFEELYEILYGKRFGLRNGVIPIYLSIFLAINKEELILYNGDKEIELTVDNINKINENPNKYYVLLEKLKENEVKYINKLDKLFNRNSLNNKMYYNKSLTIFMNMQKWIQSLPKYTRIHNILIEEDGSKNIEEEKENFRKLLFQFNPNPREIIMKLIPKKVANNEDLDVVYGEIESIKNYYDNHIKEFKLRLSKKVINIFYKDYEGTLKPALKKWYSDLDTTNKERIYDVTTTKFLRYIKDLEENNEEQIIEKICQYVTGLYIEDWEDNIAEEFVIKLQKIKNNVENKVSSDIQKIGYKVIAYNAEKTEKKIIPVKEISGKSQMLYDELLNIIDEYSQSLDSSEKGSVLIKLLERYM